MILLLQLRALKIISIGSRRIDEQNRLIYDIDELQNIKIIRCREHYED